MNPVPGTSAEGGEEQFTLLVPEDPPPAIANERIGQVWANF